MVGALPPECASYPGRRICTNRSVIQERHTNRARTDRRACSAASAPGAGVDTVDTREPALRPAHVIGKPDSLLVTTLVTRLAKQLAMLLLRHALTTLLNNGTHRLPPIVGPPDTTLKVYNRRAEHKNGLSAAGLCLIHATRKERVNRGLRNPVGAPNPDSRKLTGMNHPVDRHARNPRQIGNFGHSHKLRLRGRKLRHPRPSLHRPKALIECVYGHVDPRTSIYTIPDFFPTNTFNPQFEGKYSRCVRQFDHTPA